MHLQPTCHAPAQTSLALQKSEGAWIRTMDPDAQRQVAPTNGTRPCSAGDSYKTEYDPMIEHPNGPISKHRREMGYHRRQHSMQPRPAQPLV